MPWKSYEIISLLLYVKGGYFEEMSIVLSHEENKTSEKKKENSRGEV